MRLTMFWAREVGSLFSFGNERFKPQGCTPGIWPSWGSGTFRTKNNDVANIEGLARSVKGISRS